MRQKRYSGTAIGRDGAEWRVDILQESVAIYPEVGDLTFDAEEGIMIEWPESAKEEVIQGSTCTLRVLSESDRRFVDLYTIEVGAIAAEVYRDGRLYWSGSLDPEFYEEPYERLRDYIVTLTFSDLGVLSRLKYDLAGMQTVDAIVRHGLRRAGVEYNDYVEMISTRHTDGAPLRLADLKVRSDNFTDEDGEQSTLSETITGVLQPLGLKLRQRGGNIYIYDLNALCVTDPTDIYWSGDSQTLGVDKVANNVRVTFSPYAQSALVSDEIDWRGPEGNKVNLTNTPKADGEYYSWYDDYNPNVNHVGWDYGNISFTMFLSDKARGLGEIGTGLRYFKIQPMLGGEGSEGVCYGFYTGGHGALTSGWPQRKCKLGSLDVSSGNMVLKSKRVFLPKLPEEERGRYYLRLTQPLLIDCRYNPFTEKGEYNEGGNQEELEQYDYAFIPFSATIYDTDDNACVHYGNKDIINHGGDGNLGVARGEWTGGEAQWDDAWLEYYQTGEEGKPALGGWTTNRHTFGFRWAETDDPTKPRYYHMSPSFERIPAGEYIPYPPMGGWLEVRVYEGVKMYGTVKVKGGIRMWRSLTRAMIEKLRWVLYKAPKVEVVRNDIVMDSADSEDIEFSGYINKSAKEDISIDTICGTGENLPPTSRGAYYTADDKMLGKLTRQGVTDRPERLLIGTLCTHYGRRMTRLEGECRIDPWGLHAYTEQNQGDRLFMAAQENHDCIADTADTTFIEIKTDEYHAIEEVDE